MANAGPDGGAVRRQGPEAGRPAAAGEPRRGGVRESGRQRGVSSPGSLILAADIGGTKTNVALFELAASHAWAARVLAQASLTSASYAGLGELLQDFFGGIGAAAGRPIAAACFGLPGPVVAGTCETSNLPWHVRAAELGARFSIPSVSLLNDLEATAHAIAVLEPSELLRLSTAAAAEPGRARAVIAAGTGLGMALLAPSPQGFVPLASEGGHVELAPQDELELALLRDLLREHEHVSIERVVSGPGLVRLYRFFSERGEVVANPEVAALVHADPTHAPAVVTRAALAGDCAVSAQALELFVRLYGAVAGNLCLTAYATGGVYLAGGIAPKLASKLAEGGFMRAFNAKGRLSSVTQRAPVYVVMNEQAPLLGAARYASLSLPGAPAV